MGLFSKKYCDICGDKIGFLGNRKLEDGNMCKNCAGKLSPWFSERRHSNLEEIKAQLAYREENKAKVAEFRVTRSIGEDMKVLIDEGARKFMVTGASDIGAANPDVLDFSDLRSCRLDIDESREELTKEDSEGNVIHYNPRRYKYSYVFYMQLDVDNPYFDDMRFRLNDSDLEIEVSARYGSTEPADFHPENDYEYRKYVDMAEEIKRAFAEKQAEEPQEPQEPREAEAEPAAGQAVQCPWCGKTTSGTAGHCEFCGGALD